MSPKNHFVFLGFPKKLCFEIPEFCLILTKEARGIGPSSDNSSIAHNPKKALDFIIS